MSAGDLLAGTVMDAAASLMNDTAKTTYTYVAQVPYLRLALKELQEYFELHSIPVTQDVSAILTVPIGTTKIGYATTPALPADFIEPNQVWESPNGQSSFFPMKKVDYLIPSNNQLGSFGVFSWQSQELRFGAANRINDIKLDYIKHLFTAIVNETSIINIVNAETFLEYRTAALCAEFIERNKPSSDGLNSYAGLAIDRAAGISVKGKQSIMTRRRGFRASYKRRA